MGVEIERKFLVRRDSLPVLSGGFPIRQGYLPTEETITVRTRIMGKKGFVTIKGKSSDNGLSRSEFEYEIPLEDAEAMMAEFCPSLVVEKIRYVVTENNRRWEIDVFGGENEGLILAEIELEDALEEIVFPDWIESEVTGDVRFYNKRLAMNPWKSWG